MKIPPIRRSLGGPTCTYKGGACSEKTSEGPECSPLVGLQAQSKQEVRRGEGTPQHTELAAKSGGDAFWLQVTKRTVITKIVWKSC